MRYAIRHITTYRYGAPVTFAQCTLVLQPRGGPGQQVEETALAILPRPATRATHQAFFGHAVTSVQITAPHRELRIEATSTVVVDRPPPSHEGPAWEAIVAAARRWPSLAAEAPAHFLFPSPMVPLVDGVTAYVGEDFVAGRPVLTAGFATARRIRREFRYDPDATQVTTPLAEAFAARHGVCQDYAHILIAGLRGLGLPARYVSGYIRTVPPLGQPRLEGADATHAWVDLWCGPDLGWVGLDPTNAILAGDDHIVLATGRDYADVAPVGGILLGASGQTVDVNVDVVPLDAGG
ncbi:transglutaminase family protein [Lichenihabitans sp. Uapishka_5]|uniref:transglutaminase family protein n=1 Tax=Lichenihabitans sp. Uapishka_5 TaxID=3037302 RepID=UPI0029E82010|nr:transglutaminase family protein [Lichenihabitans sp. Uapishka_5]MDX7952967.1 transglutaminase family protein [Lichenihabitans sp. Uapishka_5]